MKRTAGLCVVLTALGGCASPDGGGGPGPGPAAPPMMGARHGGRPEIPGVQGAWGQPVQMAMPYAASPPGGAQLAQAMMSRSVPLSSVQGGNDIMLASAQGGQGGVMNAGGFTPPGMKTPPVLSPPGVPGMPGMPGGMPGMPGGIQQVNSPMVPPMPRIPNVVAAAGAIHGPGGPQFPSQRTEIRFVGPAGMKITWPDATGSTRGNQIEAPGRYNFLQGAVYRLKFTDLPGRPGIDLYPTLEVVPANLRTDAYIAHSAVPLYLTDEDIEQVLGGNFLVKVIYLPNPQFADVAVTGGPDEIVSTRLEPGLDPIAEALKRGSIMLILRVGNIDLEAPNTPGMGAPNPYQQQPCPPGMGMPMMGGGQPPISFAPAPGGMPLAAVPNAPMPNIPGHPAGAMMGGGMPMMPQGGMPMVPPGGGMPMMPQGGMPMMPPGGGMPMMGGGMPMMPPGAMPTPGINPTSATVPAAPETKPVGKTPETTSLRPVKYAEPTSAATPAQLAGQGR